MCRFADIGTPKGFGTADVGSQAAVDAWLAAAARLFPSSAQAHKSSADADLELYAEPGKATADPLYSID